MIIVKNHSFMQCVISHYDRGRFLAPAPGRGPPCPFFGLGRSDATSPMVDGIGGPELLADEARLASKEAVTGGFPRKNPSKVCCFL